MKKAIILTLLLGFSLMLPGANIKLTLQKKGENCLIDGNKLIVTLPENSQETRFAEFKFDATPFAGSFVTGSVNGKFTGPALDKKSGKGVWVQLAYPAIDGSHERLGGGMQMLFEKGKLPLSVSFDPHVKDSVLRLGLKGCGGQAEFDLNSFKLETLFAKDTSDYQCEYSDAIKNRPVHRGVMSPCPRMDREDYFQELKKWNVNLMRLQMNIGGKPSDYPQYIRNYIDNIVPKVLDLGEKYGIKIIVDLHMVPGGGQMRGNQTIFDSDESVNFFYRIWEEIATKFHNHPALYGYDLINEPSQNCVAKYNYWDIQRIAAEKIRKIDPETPIYIASNHLNSPLSFCYLKPVKLKNIIYQVHFYEPFDYTHVMLYKKSLVSGKEQYRTFPGLYYGTFWSENLVEFRKKLAMVRDFEQKHKAKIYIGEFSAQTYAPGSAKYIESCIRLFEEYGWDWTYHAFREAKMWDVEYAGTAVDDLTPSDHTPSKQVLLKAFSKNKPEK